MPPINYYENLLLTDDSNPSLTLNTPRDGVSDSKSGETVQKANLPARFSHTCVIWGGVMYIFGGESFDKEYHNNMIVIDIQKNAWSYLEVEGEKPEPRKGHTAELVNGEMFIFNGVGKDGQLYNDVYKFSLKTHTWTKIDAFGHVPSGRYNHTTAIGNGCIYLYGGFNGEKVLSDFYCMSLSNYLWTLVHNKETSMRAPPKQGHSMFFFDGYVVVVGGPNSKNDQELDILKYSTEKEIWSQVLYDVQSANSENMENTQRLFHSDCILDKDTFTMYLFGGTDPSNANRMDQIVFILTDPLLSNEMQLEMNLLANLPKSDWEAAAMYYQPEVLSLCERLRPFTGEESHGRKPKHLVSRTQATVTLKSQDVLMMVMEWLALNGYSETVKRLRKDTNIQNIKRFHTKGSSLELLIALAKKRIKPGQDIWEDGILQQLYDEQIVESIDHLPDWHLTQKVDENLVKNMWDEDLGDHLMVPDGYRVTFASLNTSILLLLDYQGFFDKEVPMDVIEGFANSFFYGHHSYTTSNVVFEKLEQLFDVPEELHEKISDVSEHRMAIVDLIKQWIRTTPWDWTNESLLRQLNTFIDGPLSLSDQSFLARDLKEALQTSGLSNSFMSPNNSTIRQSNRPKTYSVSLNTMLSMNLLPGNVGVRRADTSIEPVVPKNIFSSKLVLDDVAEIEIARQLTIMHFSLFSQIKPREFLNRWWKTDEIDYQCSNLQIVFKRNEKLNRWVRCSLLKAHDRKAMIKVYERMVKIAESLKNLNNFDTLCTIMKALNSEKITKFKLYDSADRNTRKNVDVLIQIERKESFYRKMTLMTDTSNGCIPYLGHILHSIGKIETETDKIVLPPTRDGTCVFNYEKCKKLTEEMRLILKFQSVKYNLLPVYQIATLLKFDGLENEKEVEELATRALENSM